MRLNMAFPENIRTYFYGGSWPWPFFSPPAAVRGSGSPEKAARPLKTAPPRETARLRSPAGLRGVRPRRTLPLPRLPSTPSAPRSSRRRWPRPVLDLHYTLLRPEAFGISPGEPKLGVCTLEDMIQSGAAVQELADRLAAFDRSLLTEDQALVYDALSETLQASLMGRGLELYEQPLAPTIGVQAQLPILLAEYSFHSLKDVEDYLALYPDRCLLHPDPGV